MSDKNVIEPKLVWTKRLEPELCGITYEVCKWGKSWANKPCWNTYLYIFNEDMVDFLWSNDCKKYSWGEILNPHEMLESLDWNGGQTYYHQIIDRSFRYIKIGDDYQHSWDAERNYDEHYLLDKIERIAKQLIKAWSTRTPQPTE